MGIMLDYKIMFLFIIPIWILARLVSIIKNRSRGQFSIKREVVLNIFFAYIICFIAITLFPLIMNWDGSRGMVSINITPVFNTINDVANITQRPEMHNFMIKFWIKNILGNALLLFPFGLFLPILWKKFGNMKITLIVSFLFSLGIETIQLLSYYIGNIGRSFDIDDIILNIFGAWLGYIFYKKIVIRLNNKQLLNGIQRNVN